MTQSRKESGLSNGARLLQQDDGEGEDKTSMALVGYQNNARLVEHDESANDEAGNKDRSRLNSQCLSSSGNRKNSSLNDGFGNSLLLQPDDME